MMGTDALAARELGAFLLSRRERTRPEDLGLEPGPRRKVTGLRREEVAALAGLSTDYYQRLEQGRALRPSDPLLDSIAEGLALDETEHRHLLTLGRRARQPQTHRRHHLDRVPANTRALLSALALPAIVLGKHLDVLAWNHLAGELIGVPADLRPGSHNLLIDMFRGDEARIACKHWESDALDYIGMLRTAVSDDPDHPRAVAVVGELSITSADFRRFWARHDIRERVQGSKTISHPRVGDIAVKWDAYPLPGNDGPVMIVFSPTTPADADRVQVLASLSEQPSARTPALNTSSG